MEYDDDCELECSIIAFAGDARSKALMAVKEAKKRQFDKAEELLQQAADSLLQAHQITKGVIQREASGQQVHSGVLMIHAQDHLNAATVSINMAEEFLEVYRVLDLIEKRVNE